MLADDLVARLFLGVLVNDTDRGAELHLTAGQPRDIDDLGSRHAILDLGDAALDPALPILGGVILRVFGEVAMRARFADGGRDRRPLLRLETPQLFVEGMEALGGHRYLVHG